MGKSSPNSQLYSHFTAHDVIFNDKRIDRVVFRSIQLEISHAVSEQPTESQPNNQRSRNSASTTNHHHRNELNQSPFNNELSRERKETKPKLSQPEPIHAFNHQPVQKQPISIPVQKQPISTPNANKKKQNQKTRNKEAENAPKETTRRARQSQIEKKKKTAEKMSLKQTNQL